MHTRMTHVKLKTKNKDRAAFTLMELLVVMTIMAIITTIAIGSYFGITRAAAYAAAHDTVYNTLVLAKQRAVIDGKVTSLMILNDTEYVVVRGVGRISHVDGGVAYDAYSDLSGAMPMDGRSIAVYNLDALVAGDYSRDVLINSSPVPIDDPFSVSGASYSTSGFVFTGADSFFTVGDRYGFALHAKQKLPRGYEFESSPLEIRFNGDGSCETAADITLVITETIRPTTQIEFTITPSGTVTDESVVL